MLEIKASKRDKTGTYATKNIIRQGFLPATIQNGNNAPLHIQLEKPELEKIHATGLIFSQLIKINLDGSVLEVTVNKIDLHPVDDNIIHLDFINYTNSKEIKLLLKIEFINRDKSIGLKKGGFLNVRKRNLAVIADKNSTVDSIFKVDIANLAVGEKIRLADLVTPKNIRILNQKDDLVTSITGRGIKAEAEKEEGKEEEADK
jgi:large subunit ribosomal protein L25